MDCGQLLAKIIVNKSKFALSTYVVVGSSVTSTLDDANNVFVSRLTTYRMCTQYMFITQNI